MPAFKPKVNKKIKINKKSMITLDNKHSEILEKINKKENEELPKLIKKQEELKKKLNSKTISLEDSLEIKDTLKELKRKIQKIKNEKNEYL